MSNKLKNLLTLIASIFLIVACSSTPSAKNYFVLKNYHHTDINNISGTPHISIQRVKLPKYFNQLGIVRATSKGRISQSNQQLWAEKLSFAIPTLLAKDLTVILQSPIETHPLPPGISVDTAIEVEISQLIGDENQLTLQSSYRLIRPKKLATYHFNTQVALADNTTETLVEAHSQILFALAKDIAKKLK